ncbi:Hypothetical predicted protein [Paramuricea clavata]|uniref:Uncharacterized protein n=1 Tax=Paramuricea clavata TaxID=317549 RepID=A0A6S7H2D0_PARCT|nr:Hypothetical predicted protein [Paramuricea clavata]
MNVDVSLEQDERVSNLTENSKQIDDRNAWNKIDLSKMVRKGTAMKTLRNELRIQKSPVLPFSTSSPPENDLKDIDKRETFASLTTQHLRNRREIDSKSEYTQEDLLLCNNSIINIKYDDEYKVQTDFSDELFNTL